VALAAAAAARGWEYGPREFVSTGPRDGRATIPWIELRGDGVCEREL
jgi:hypothetical protein